MITKGAKRSQISLWEMVINDNKMVINDNQKEPRVFIKNILVNTHSMSSNKTSYL